MVSCLWRWFTAGVFVTLVVALLLPLLLLLLLLLSARRPNHWRRLGVRHRRDHFPLGARSAAALLGSYPAALRREYAEVRAAGGVQAHLDAAGPAVTVSDLGLVHRVMTADFGSFSDRRPAAPRTTTLSNMMMNLPAEEWRPLRDTLTPAFSAARMRRAAPLLQDRARRLAAQALREGAAGGEQGIEVEALFQRYTLDCISAVSFGLETGAIEQPDSELVTRARDLVWRPAPWTVLLRTAASRLGLARWLPSATSRADEAIAFFAQLTLDTAARRRAAGAVRCEDALQLLMEHLSRAGEPLSDRQLAAQGAMLFLGGYGNTAAALAWSARCLAHHPAVQERLRRELQQHRNEGASDALELVSQLSYLDQVVREVLRMYPAATPQLARCATAPYRFPGGLSLPAHGSVYIPVLGIHHDPALYPEPDLFDPNRFAESERWGRPAAAWLPFGLGPRGCPGTRLALLELKLALVELLNSCQLELCLRSGSARPHFVPGAGVMREQGGTWLGVRAGP
ncbi:putative cytochrome P450 6a14 [Amphibalanus amphitrite]|uniref:Putative cytochrome P450 6a14 n=2 Tax=Amphibalanus amphitrite TaxID=1232801 RepID=A0A6A4V5V8_AMPAM|nr:putative cytochrome P450 6a14 [Amphibalanus amphitrite]